MDALNTFLSLLARTQGRDKCLRFLQYACLHSLEGQDPKNPTSAVYKQVRMTRKMLRFLRSLQYSTKIKEEVPKLMNSLMYLPGLLKYLTSILQSLFNILYFLSDHRVCLSELGVIDASYGKEHLPKSMKFYFLMNVFGVLRNLVEIVNQSNKSNVDKHKKIRSMFIDLLRCFLDCFVALYYWVGAFSAKKIGAVGVVTSVIGIGQSLGYF